MGNRVHFVTLGCAKNEVDTDRMRANVLAHGFEVVDSIEQADAVVLNTCSFLVSATEEGIDYSFDILNDDFFIANNAKLVITGCMPSRYGDELEESLTEAHAFLAAEDEDSLPQLLSQLLDTSATKISDGALRTVEGTSAYLKISEGCDRYCSFCAIPYIRGHYYSRSLDELIQEAASLVDGGVRELVLVGQDTSVWGCDLEPKRSLSYLVQKVAENFPKTWIRVLYLQPEEVSDELIEVIASHENVCNYFDIPMQHVNTRLLENMNRHGSAKEFLALIEKIRARFDGNVVIRSTFITGFPGESEEDFDELCKFVEDAQLDYTGVFTYSAEEGTPAAEMEDQIPEQVKLDRAQQIRDLGDSIGFAKASDMIGKEFEVLFEGYETDENGNDVPYGRWMGQAPDTDGIVRIYGDFDEPLVRVKAFDSICYDLDAEVLNG